MSEREFVYQMRLKIFQKADKKEIPIVLLCKKHHVSRKWFYKWQKRRERLGDEGLRSKIRKAPKMPNRVPEKTEEQISNFIKEYPTYEPERTEAELKSAGISVGHTAVFTISLRKEA